MVAKHEQGTADTDPIIPRTCCRILEQFNQTIDFEQMARELGMSLPGFRKKFQKATGLPPGQYQRQIQINKAVELLRQSDLAVGEIAERLGFENVYYFSRFFKKKTGRPPISFRRESG